MKRRQILQDIILYLLDILTVLIAYVAAVVIRYYVMDSEIGIKPLSLPYMLIAIIYSLIMANALQLVHKDKRYMFRTDTFGYLKLLSANMIGCLGLLSFFYIANAIYFSRIALLLFGILSSVFGIIKNEAVRIYFAKKRSAGQDILNVLVVGNGKLAKLYVNAIMNNPWYGYRVNGYIAQAEGKLEIEKVVEAEGDLSTASFDVLTTGKTIQIPYRGKLKDFAKILSENDIDEVVFALDEEASTEIEYMIYDAKKINVGCSMITPNNRVLPNGPMVTQIGDVKIIGLGNSYRESRGVYRLGLTVSISLLLLFMLMRSINEGSLQGFRRFESYKSPLFAVSGFFLFLIVNSTMKIKSSIGNLKCSGFTWIVSVLMIAVYEWIYYMSASNTMQRVLHAGKSDLLLTTILIAACCMVNQFVYWITKDSTPLMF